MDYFSFLRCLRAIKMHYCATKHQIRYERFSCVSVTDTTCFPIVFFVDRLIHLDYFPNVHHFHKPGYELHSLYLRSATDCQFIVSDPVTPTQFLTSLVPTTPAEAERLIRSASAKTSALDLLPTSVLKVCDSEFSKRISHIANR